jgi:glutaredoxin
MKPRRASIVGLVVLVLCVSATSQWWSGRGQDRLGERMAALARPGDIHMLSSQTCALCAQARLWMQQRNVSFSECFIETDKDCSARFETARAPGTPVLLVRGQSQLGFDAQRVIDALGKSVPAP